MPRRRFSEGSAGVLWEELVALRDGPGLTPARVESLAPQFLALPQIRRAWDRRSHLRGEVGCSLLMIWANQLGGPIGRHISVAYNVADDIPPEQRVNLTARRRFVANEVMCSASTAQSRENKAIELLIRDLLSADVDAEAKAGETIYELKQPGRPWTGIAPPMVIENWDLTGEVQVASERWEFTYDSSKRLTSVYDSRLIEAIDDEIEATGTYINFPGIALQRVSIEMIEGASLRQLLMVGGYFGLDFRLHHRLAPGEQCRLRYRIRIDGRGDFESFQRFSHEYPLARLTTTIVFDPSTLPKNVWWFTNLPRDATPGSALPSRLLYPTVAKPKAEKVLHNLQAGPHYHGIGWEW